MTSDVESYINCRVAPTYQVNGQDFDLKTCIYERLAGGAYSNRQDAFIEAWYTEAKNWNFFFCLNIPDSFACMASNCLGSSENDYKQDAVDCDDEPIPTNVILQALGDADRYHKEVGLPEAYPELLQAYKNEMGYEEGDYDI